MNILVTGAAGFIGSHLAQRLAALGHRVRGLDCFTDYYARPLKELNARHVREQGIELVTLDLATDELGPVLADIEIVYHAAAQPGISATTPFDTYVRNNLLATHRLLMAARQSAAFQGFVNISTSSVYGADATGDETSEPRPTSYYGVTKLAAEQLALAFTRDQGLPACSLRLFSVYGPRERPEKLYPRLIGAILDDRDFPLYEGSLAHLRSYTYVGDAVDGMVAVLDHFDRCVGEIINVGTQASFSTEHGIRVVEAILGKYARLSIRPRRPGDQLKTQADISKARRLLGYDPSTTLEAGLAQEVAWYKQHIAGKINLWPDQR